jgi:hypothetical protein
VLCKNSPLWQKLRGGDSDTLKMLEEITAE